MLPNCYVALIEKWCSIHLSTNYVSLFHHQAKLVKMATVHIHGFKVRFRASVCQLSLYWTLFSVACSRDFSETIIVGDYVLKKGKCEM